MRLHQLVLTGIGPFADRVEIDFTRLGEAGLFLLEGPTGAGKSTIIDAISFALYGKVAQASGDAERLRSHFAAPGAESFVELTWECQAGLYRVKRTPKYSRPKRRGDGLTNVNPTVLLWRLDQLEGPGTAELLSNRIDEAADEITHVLGLSHAQFVQTVVLPQGEFANFLRSSSDEKRALLQKVFGTELLARVQAELVQRRQAAERQRASADQELALAVHAFAGAAGVSEASSPSSADFHTALVAADLAGLTTMADQVVQQLAADAGAAEGLADAAESARVAAGERLQLAKDAAARRAQRIALAARLATLRDGADDERLLAEEILAAQRAAPVAAVAQAYDQTAARHTAAARLADARRLRLPAQWRAEDELGLRAHIDHLNRIKGGLAEHVGREDSLRELKAARRELADARQLASDAALAIDADLRATEAGLAQSHAERATAATEAASVALLSAERDRQVGMLAAAIDAGQAAADLAVLQTRATEALASETAATHRLRELRQRRLDGIASELGLALVPNEPCLVCGSVEHPQPARPGAGHVTEAQVRRAETSLAELSALTTEAVGALADTRDLLAGFTAAAGGKSPSQAQADLTTAAANLDSALAAARRLVLLDERLSELAVRKVELAERHRATASDVEVLTERLERSQLDLDQGEARLIEARAGFGTVGDRLVDIQGQIDVLDDAVVHISASTSSQSGAEHARSHLDKALAEAGFDLRDAFAAAFRSPAALDGLRGRLGEIRAEWRAVQDGLAALSPSPARPSPASQPDAGLFDADLSEALDAEPDDLTALTAELAQAQEHAGAATADLGSATDRARRALVHAGLIGSAVKNGAAVLAGTAAAVRLGYLAAGLGDNQLRMDLATYVLVRRFEQIVAAANEQLLRVSGGRYLLEHSDAKQGNARSGLGLRVLDLRTDRARDPATLSGGETFYVSLSLALGLADVVRAESGGVDLGTLFIDEGFGSLDSDVLDEVLAVLDGLRAGGRVVGVVSHVSELKARIADRIEIRPGADGSSTLSVVA